jgi:plasmid maintenance system antidote protein VapI
VNIFSENIYSMKTFCWNQCPNLQLSSFYESEI